MKLLLPFTLIFLVSGPWTLLRIGFLFFQETKEHDIGSFEKKAFMTVKNVIWYVCDTCAAFMPLCICIHVYMHTYNLLCIRTETKTDVDTGMDTTHTHTHTHTQQTHK